MYSSTMCTSVHMQDPLVYHRTECLLNPSMQSTNFDGLPKRQSVLKCVRKIKDIDQITKLHVPLGSVEFQQWDYLLKLSLYEEKDCQISNTESCEVNTRTLSNLITCMILSQ